MAPIEHGSHTSPTMPRKEDGLRLSASVHLAEGTRTFAQSTYPLVAEACAHDQLHAPADATLADCPDQLPACARVGDAMSCSISGTATCASRAPGSTNHAII